MNGVYYHTYRFDMNICPSNACVNGECHTWDRGYYCDCFDGWTGEECNHQINECLPDPCLNGLCGRVVNGYSCECKPGWTGQNCDQGTTTVPERSTTTAENASNSEQFKSDDEVSLTAGGIAGLSVGGVVGCIVLILLGVSFREVCIKRMNKKKNPQGNINVDVCSNPASVYEHPVLAITDENVYASIELEDAKSYFAQNDTKSSVSKTQESLYPSLDGWDTEHKYMTASDGFRDDIWRNVDRSEARITGCSSTTPIQPSVTRDASQGVGEQPDDYLVLEDESNQETIEDGNVEARYSKSKSNIPKVSQNPTESSENEEYSVISPDSDCHGISDGENNFEVESEQGSNLQNSNSANYFELEPEHGSNGAEQPDGSKCIPEQDQYGYSHMPSSISTVATNDGTYDHTLTQKTNGDDYGYSHSPDSRLNTENWMNDPEYSHTANFEL